MDIKLGKEGFGGRPAFRLPLGGGKSQPAYPRNNTMQE